jgi:hypothetical protein
MPAFRDEWIWRWLTNIWTFVLLAVLVADFIEKGAYDAAMPALSIVYTGALGLYAGTKEFDRWYERHESRHPGEIFIGIWTAVIFILFAAQFVLGGDYKVSSEMVADYIMVLSVFALTQKSKTLHRRKRQGH